MLLQPRTGKKIITQKSLLQTSGISISSCSKFQKGKNLPILLNYRLFISLVASEETKPGLEF